MRLSLCSYCEKYYYFWAMKTKRPINYVLIIAGAGCLFLSASFPFKEIGLAVGFALLMAGLYGLSRNGGTTKTEDEDG